MDDRIATEVRTYFEHRLVPSPGLPDRVVNGLAARPRPLELPKLAAFLAAVLAILVALPFGALMIANRFNSPAGPAGTAPALSLGVVNGHGAWMVERDISNTAPGQVRNDLYQTTDGGRTWHERLVFDGVYDGMSSTADGKGMVAWAIDMQPQGCFEQQGKYLCAQPASYKLLLYTSSDGGATWVAQGSPPWPARDVYFSGIEGWVVSDAPTKGRSEASPIYHTADGGAHWNRVGSLPVASWTREFGVNDSPLRFIDESTGWYATWQKATPGHSGLFVTRDGGATWTEQPFEALAGYDMVLELPVVFGDRYMLPVGARAIGGADNATPNLIYAYTSTDGGRTWSEPRRMLGPVSASFQPVGDRWQAFYLDAGHWWLTSQSNTAGDNVQAKPAVARTSDGGRTWQVFAPAPRILVMSFADPANGWAEDVTGEKNTNGLLKTSDGGAHWTRVAIP